MDVRPFLMTDTPATKLIQPGESLLTTHAIAPIHCHAWRFVWGAKGRCRGHADLAEMPPVKSTVA